MKKRTQIRYKKFTKSNIKGIIELIEDYLSIQNDTQKRNFNYRLEFSNHNNEIYTQEDNTLENILDQENISEISISYYSASNPNRTIDLRLYQGEESYLKLGGEKEWVQNLSNEFEKYIANMVGNQFNLVHKIKFSYIFIPILILSTGFTVFYNINDENNDFFITLYRSSLSNFFGMTIAVSTALIISDINKKFFPINEFDFGPDKYKVSTIRKRYQFIIVTVLGTILVTISLNIISTLIQSHFFK